MHNIETALEGVGWVHSSDENFVMRLERRGPVIITLKLKKE